LSLSIVLQLPTSRLKRFALMQLCESTPYGCIPSSLIFCHSDFQNSSLDRQQTLEPLPSYLTRDIAIYTVGSTSIHDIRVQVQPAYSLIINIAYITLSNTDTNNAQFYSTQASPLRFQLAHARLRLVHLKQRQRHRKQRLAPKRRRCHPNPNTRSLTETASRTSPTDKRTPKHNLRETPSKASSPSTAQREINSRTATVTYAHRTCSTRIATTEREASEILGPSGV
jgi:hypothetical protein